MQENGLCKITHTHTQKTGSASVVVVQGCW